MADLRPTTNLVVPKEFALPRADQKKGFFYVYSGAYKGSETAFMTGLWASVLFPSMYNDPRWGKVKMRAAAEQLYKRTPSGFLKVQKTGDKFLVSIPLFHFPKYSAAGLVDFMDNWMVGNAHTKKRADLPEGTVDELHNFTADLNEFAKDVDSGKVIPAQKVIEAMKLDAIGSAALKNCLQGVRVAVRGNLCVIFADFVISKIEAERLTITPWARIRNIDIYPLLLHWMKAGFGARGTVPLASFSVSSVVFSLPASHVESARVNDLGLSIGPDGKPYYIPRSIDKAQTVSYEDKYTAAGQQEDGSFAFHTLKEGAETLESGKEIHNKLPKNMVVAVDWLNNKYSYTNTEGGLTVEDLTRFQPANASHLMEVLDRTLLTTKEITWFLNMGEAAGVPRSEFHALPKDFDEVSEQFKGALEQVAGNPLDWFETVSRIWISLNGPDSKLHMSDITEKGFPPLGALARFFKRIETSVKENIEAVYTKYSVSTVMSMFPWLVMIANYTDNMEHLRADAYKIRGPAINQKVDPDWKMPSVPLIKNDMGLLPHQMKINNLMKDDPDLAILPVQAGGGKSPLLLIDILLRFKDNENAPYLVLCPNHLVPNYVKEAVYFTDGKLNVIAITNVAIRQNGWPRLQKICEAAPRNTVVVVALDTLRYRARNVSYGTEPTTIFPVIDFLRQFKFQYVAVDEAHKIKGKTARNKSVMALLADIPKKRLASGTFAHDSASDLAPIIAALDPTVFGTKEEFNAEYGEVVRGDRVVEWKKGAELKIMEKIKSRVVVAGAMRKEWAAFLPKRVEKVFGVELTGPQQAVYNDLLAATIDQIEQDAKTKKQLGKLLGKKGSAEDEESEDEVEGETEEQKDADEEEGEDLASMLNPYLARLEQFLIAPGSDPLGKAILRGEDLLSPKVAKCYERIRLHLFGGGVRNQKTGQMEPYGPFPGKVLVFVNQIEAAEEVFNKAPADLKKLGLLYKASDKVELLSELENNPNKRWMVGVVQSMEEGLNLQVGARIVRLSSPWNPGNLEQSNSRIERPEFKKQETRSQVFFDTIVADHTYDITKQSRLIAKVIAAAKFENTDNPAYEEIPKVRVIPMNLETIQTLNSWRYVSEENPGLEEYLQAQQLYEKVRNDDYEDYKEAYIAKHGSGPVMTSIGQAPTPPDAKLLLRTPYVPGLGLYSEKELGLVRLDEYLNLPPEVGEDEEQEQDEGDEESEEGQDEYYSDAERAERAAALKDQLVHTEYGDGYISRGLSPRGKFVSIELLNGYRARARRSQVFLVTRTLTSNKDIKNLIARAIGKMPHAIPEDVPAAFWRASKRAEELRKIHERKFGKRTVEQAEQPMPTPVTPKQKQAQEVPKKADAIQLTIFVSNGFLGIDYLLDEEQGDVIRVLQSLGFRTTPSYYYAQMKNANHMRNQFNLWAEKGLKPDPTIVKQGIGDAINGAAQLMKSGQLKNHVEVFKLTKGTQVRNFYTQEQKPSKDSMTFKPYPILQDGKMFIALPQNQAGSRTAMKFRRPLTKWVTSDPAMAYFGTVQQVVKAIKDIRAAGITISNIKELDQQVTKLKPMKFRHIEDFFEAADTTPAEVRQDKEIRKREAPVKKGPATPKESPKVKPQDVVKPKKKLKVPKEFEDENY